MMKKKFSQHIRKGLPGGANEVSSFTKGVVSTEGYRIDSPDKDNPFNLINSGNITMTESNGRPLKKGPLFGMDNLGNKQLMMPGFNYQFPGSQVLEMPMAEEGIIVEASDEEIEEYKRGGYIVEEMDEGGESGPGDLPVLPPEYLRSEGFEKAVNEDLYSILGGFKTDGYDSHYYTGKVLDQGATDQQLREFSSEYHPRKFLNAAAYAKVMNELAVDAGGKNVSNIPFADNPTVMRTSDDDIEYQEYYAPETIVQEGKFNPKTLNAIQFKADPDGMEMEEGGQLPKAQPGRQTDEELLRHQIGKIMDYEYNRGSQYGTGLSNYGNPKLKSGATREDAINWAMENIGPDLIYYQTPLEKGEAADFIYNTGKDPRAYAIQEYYRKYDKNQLKNNNWPGRKGSNFTDTYKSTIGKLPENERRILMNKGRDWYYQNIEKGKGSINEDLKAYKNTWYGRIHNTNDLEDYIPNNPKFKYPRKKGGELTSYQDKGEAQGIAGVSIQDADIIPGSKIIDVVPVLETGNCPEGYQYSSERKACVKKEITIANTTIYSGKEGKKKQRKLLDKFQLAQAAFTDWHNDAGLGNLILKGRRDKDDIKSLKGYVDDYKEELNKKKEQYKPAISALKVLKEYYPKEWKNLKLKHVFDPQSVEQLRKLYKEDKISDSAFRWYYNSFGKGYDQNVAKDTYSAKETKDIWRDTGKDWDKLGYGVNMLMMGLALPATLTAADVAALGTAAASEASMFGSFLRHPLNALRAIPGTTQGKIAGLALTGAGLPFAAYHDIPHAQTAFKEGRYVDAFGNVLMATLNTAPFTFPTIAKGYQAIKNAPKIKALKSIDATAALKDLSKAKQEFMSYEDVLQGSLGTNQKSLDALKYDIARKKVALKNYKEAYARRIKTQTGKDATSQQLDDVTKELQSLITQGEKTLSEFNTLKPGAQEKILNTVSPPSEGMAMVRDAEKIINEILSSPNLKHIAKDKKMDFVNAIKVDTKVPEQFVRNLNEQSLATLRAKYGQNLEGLSSETRELILATNIIPEGLLTRHSAMSPYFQTADNIAAGNIIREVNKVQKGKKTYPNFELAAELGSNRNPKNIPPQAIQYYSVRNPGTYDASISGPSIGRGGTDSFKYATQNVPGTEIKDINITRFDPGDFRFYEQTVGTGAKERTVLNKYGQVDRDQLGIIREGDLTQYVTKVDDGIKVQSPKGGFKTFTENENIVTTGEVGLKRFKDNNALDHLYTVKLPSSKGEATATTISLTNNEIKVVNQAGIDLKAVERGEINKDYITHLTENITLTEQALPGSKVFGSAAGVKGAGLPHATHDIDVIMTIDDYNKAKQNYQQVTGGVDNVNTFKLKVFDKAGPQGEIDVNVIFKAEDGTATGPLARELFRQFHPKKYYNAVMQQRKAYGETGVIPEMKISLTPDELLKGVDTEIKTIMDSFEAGAGSGKTKHLFRDNVYASYADPKKFQKAQEMFLRSFVGPKGKIGRQFDASTFSDVSKNKEILKEIDFIGDVNAVANDPLKMQNALNTFTIENSTLMRGTDFRGFKSGDDVVSYMNKAIGQSSGPGARAAGEGLNTTKGISSSGYGSRENQFQGFMQLNIDDLVNAKKLTPEEYVKALKIRSDGDIVLTEAMMNKVVEIANKHKALGLDEKALRSYKKLKAADLVDRTVLNNIFAKGASDKKLLADFYNDIAVAPELNFQAVHGTGGLKNDFGTGYYRSGLKIFDEATDAMAIDFVAFNRSRTGSYAPDYKGRAIKDFRLPKDAQGAKGNIPTSSLIEGVETVGKEGEINYSLSVPTLEKLSSNQKDLKAMINLLDGGLIKAQQRRAEILKDIEVYAKSKKEIYRKGADAYEKVKQVNRTKAVRQEYNKLKSLKNELQNIDLKISEINALKDKQAKVMSQYTKLLAVPTNIIEKSGVAEEPINQAVDLIETGVETGVEKVKEGVKEGTEAVVQFTEKVGEALKSPSQKRSESNEAVLEKVYGKDFDKGQKNKKMNDVYYYLRTLNSDFAKKYPRVYAKRVSELIKLKEAGIQLSKEEQKKLNKLIKENKEQGGEVKYLTDKEIEMYRAGGYVVEEL